MDTKKIENKINKSFTRFKSAIKKEFKPMHFILFGSRAKKTEFIYSDFDFVIVSDKFRDMDWHKRISKVVRRWDCEADIDVLPYTPEEFEKKKNQVCIVQQAVRDGIEV